jgi:hypothetical protein
MAEISYPFADDSAGGGSKNLSQVQWQAMARMWGGDRVDFQLTSTSYASTALPFSAVVNTNRNVVVQPGKAWVGGFYYELTAPATVAVPDNLTSNPRKDLIVLQANLSTGSVNIKLVQGTPAASPIVPQPRRQIGSLWEMPLWEVNAGANNATVSVNLRMPFDQPHHVAYPINSGNSAALMPRGTFFLDMDTNQDGAQFEGFMGRDGQAVTRHLGSRVEYTPDLFTVTNKPSAANRKGYWRYIAPGLAYFSLKISNTSTSAVNAASGGWAIGFTLPVPTSKATNTILYGFLDNPEKRSSFPNFLHVVGKNENGGNTNCYLHYTNFNTLKEGLDGLKTIPGKSVLTITGVYETNDFD